jgi:hypothetical protein
MEIHNVSNTVILTMTTVPLRLNEPSEDAGIRPGLKTILEQTGGEFEVHLNIPWAHRLQNIVIPDWMDEWQEQYPHLKIFRCPDYGPITKILPTLERITDPEAILITVDDDLIYMDGIIPAHLEARARYPECAIGYAGMTEINDTLPMHENGGYPMGEYYFCTSQPRDARTRLVEGYKTVSYRRRFFDEDLNKFIFVHWNDDIAISAYLGYKNIKKIILACPDDCDGSNDARVESFPVIRHSPLTGEPNGCRLFRNDDELLAFVEHKTNEWYALGYLER